MNTGNDGWANLYSNTSVYLAAPFNLRLAMHEMGHCLGGNHSNGSDLGCSLGGADVDYNASKKILFGWLNTPAGNVLTLPANTGTSQTLVPLSRDPDVMPGIRAIRIPNPNGGTATFLVSYKIDDGPYNTLQNSSYARKVHVTEDAGSSSTTHRATLAAGQTYSNGKLNVTCNNIAADSLSADVNISVGNPVLLSIADDVAGGPITVGQSVNYTVTFDEPINASTIGTNDFENGSTAGININSVSATGNPAVFNVAVTTNAPGNLNLRIKAGAVIEDLSATPLITTSSLPDNTTIAVNPVSAPTLVSITDNVSGGPITVGAAVNYTVTFSEAIKAATLGADDFENGGSAGITVNSVSPTGNPAVFTVAVTTTSAGLLTLQIKAGAVIEDLSSTPFNSISAVPDDTTISVKSTPAPVLLSISDNVGGGPIVEGDSVSYTVTFDEPINAATVGTGDFENGTTGGFIINSVSPTANPAVFTVNVSTTFRGYLTLQIKAGAVIEDLSGFPLDTSSALPDDSTIIVNYSLSPTLLSITDNVSGGPLNVGASVSYAVTFDKPMNATTIGTDDFENGSSAAINVNSVSATANPAVFTVTVTTSSSGSLNLRIKAGTIIEDIYGLPLDTSSALPDNTTITVFAAPISLYWDSNGNTAGAGGTPTGTWGSSVFWNDNSTGGAPAGSFTASTSADNLFFVAGPGASSGNGNAAITISGAQVANSLNFQHSGAFTLSGGTSISLGNGAVGSGGVTLNQFAYGSTAQGAVSITTPVILSNAQTWTNNSATTLTTTGGLNLGANTLTFAGTGAFSTDSTNLITGAGGGIIMNGTGKLTLGASNSPVNTFSGPLTINAGAVGFQAASSLGTGNINLNGGVLAGRFSSSVTRNLGSGAGEIRITGGVTGWSGEGTSGSTLTITGTGSNPLIWGTANFNPSQFVLQGANANNNGVGSFANNIDLNGTNRTIRSDQNLASVSAGGGTFSGNITNSTGTASLTKTGGGLHRLSGTNAYNGGTTISQGTLIFSSKTAMPASGAVSVSSGATLGVTANTTTGWNGGTGNGGIAGITSGLGGQSGSTVSFNGNSGLLVDVTQNVTESGNITNGGATNLSLSKMGASTLTLSGTNNNYSGTTNILVGQLTLNGSLTGGGAISTSGTATLFQSGTGVISGASSYTQNSSGVSTLSGNNSYNGGTTISAGTLNINSATAIGSGALNLAANGVIIDNTSGGAITFSNNNVVNITNNFTFTGANSLSNGSGNFTINASRTITVSGNKLTLGGNQTATTTGGITKAGSGVLALLGSGIQTGAATLSAGILEVGVMTNGGLASSLGNTPSAATSFSMNSGTTLRYVGGSNATTDRSFTINGTTDGHGVAIESSGVGTLTYSGGPAIAYGHRCQHIRQNHRQQRQRCHQSRENRSWHMGAEPNQHIQRRDNH
jgi:autotransporter-associated beta strand protein